MLETVGTLGYAKKLGKYGFSDKLCSDKEQCEQWLDFCKKNNMIWFEDSYGTLVHKNFNNHFKKVRGDKTSDIEIELGMRDERHNQFFGGLRDHTNILKSKVNGIHIMTSSPNYLEFSIIRDYPYLSFIIHPALLEDYSLSGVNIAFANVSWEEMDEINKAIYDDLGIYGAFRWLWGEYKGK